MLVSLQMPETNAVDIFLFSLGCNQGFFHCDALKEHASLPAASHSASGFQSWPGSPILLCPATSLFSVAWSHPSLPCRGRAGYHPRDLAFLMITLTNHSDILVSGDNDSCKVKDTLSFQ